MECSGIPVHLSVLNITKRKKKNLFCNNQGWWVWYDLYIHKWLIFFIFDWKNWKSSNNDYNINKKKDKETLYSVSFMFLQVHIQKEEGKKCIILFKNQSCCVCIFLRFQWFTHSYVAKICIKDNVVKEGLELGYIKLFFRLYSDCCL